MKRKHANDNAKDEPVRKKVVKHRSEVRERFHPKLFDNGTLNKYTEEYTKSEPYKHAVVQPLISDGLLRSVRQEILDNIHFTPKETDIYKIHQSGDLANLSGLPDSALKRLPSLLQLRDAMYSEEFRAWISHVSGAGALSGKKTDMAVNVYTPGCHLLCHDDVIGSRRVSYILYLTDPDRPWKASWGGALRLYPTKSEMAEDGKGGSIPHHAWSKIIPPAWNQLSFFAVQPGQSFHDVEEVYKRERDNNEDDGGRVRMAISGWFHIPQEGEEGFEPGLEERLAEKSSLQQLQGKDDKLDLPQPQWLDSGLSGVDGDPADELTEDDIEFLLKFMTPLYLTPDTVEELSELFEEESSLQLANILSKKFSAQLHANISAADGSPESNFAWQTAQPPHKHRYLFRRPARGTSDNGAASETKKPLTDLIDVFLPSKQFHKWLSLVTGLELGKCSVLARRFRRGLDYTLATAHEDDDALLEWCVNITPSKGWSADEEEEAEDSNGDTKVEKESNGDTRVKKESNGDAKVKKESDGDTKVKKESNGNMEEQQASEEDNIGGYELYMAGDEDDDTDDDDGSNDGVEIPSGSSNPSATGGGNRRVIKQKKADPAIYKAVADEEDDGILFNNPAAWNTMSVVLRDKGTLKFVKYVSQAAKGDRWDITGSVQVLDDDDGDDDEDEDADPDLNAAEDEEDDEEEEEDEEEWNGIQD